MSISLPGFSAPAAGFEAPLAMLSACHTRVQRQCDTLMRLVPHLDTHGADPSAQQAAQAVLRYFDTAARHHHEDEEQDLFPALIESMAGSDAVCLREIIDALCAEHRLLERRWALLREPLLRIADGTATPLDAVDVPGFVVLYAQHIAREEDTLLPMAARLLDADALARMGLTMRARRGVALDQP